MEKNCRNRFSKRKPVIVSDFGKGVVKSEFKASCDINNIVKRYTKTMVAPVLSEDPLYGDFSNAKDYKESMNLVIKAQNQFDGLPAEIRKRFGNDPMEFLDYVNNDDNESEMIKLGLIDLDHDSRKKKIDVVNEDLGSKVDVVEKTEDLKNRPVPT